ncbi:hypothetical protein FSP39_016992 [Pinctada imbricata]|uniref:DET1- and DDB1-associated protein 1 domain-containing protein n=1 Tax=Pinctada imbricata TaxID=66713 RepID=A0AA88YA19_PINIB|nr:hypothetical protein FSP39_016992 [Pinctada imbricata]
MIFLIHLNLFQADFLKELPSHNEDNFTKFHADSSCKSGNLNKKRDSSRASLDSTESSSSSKMPRLGPGDDAP